MSQINSREVVMAVVAGATTNGTAPDMVLPGGFYQAFFTLDVTTVSGTTSPTLNVFVQEKLTKGAATDSAGGFPAGTAVYDDVIAFTTATTNGTTKVFPFTNGVSTTDHTLTTGALGAGTVRTGPLGDLMRVAYNIGGSGSPTFSFTVTAKLIPGSQ